MKSSETLSVVVPVYKEEGNIPQFLATIVPILGRTSLDFEIIFSMDPSPDNTETVIINQRERDPRIKLLKFSRRVGQPMASLAGLQYSRGDAVIVMDVDLQDPPELILSMVARWHEGFDVVMAQRRSRTGENWIKRLTAYLGYKLINHIAEAPIPPNTGDFRLMSRRVVNEVNKLKECHGFNGIICFSSYLLTLSSQMGFLLAGGSFLLGLVYAFMKVFGFPFPLGNPTVVILVLFMGGVQLISVGILGEYIARIYEEVKGRPKFIVDEAVGFGRSNVELESHQHVAA